MQKTSIKMVKIWRLLSFFLNGHDYSDFKKAKSKVHRRDTTLRCGHYGAHAHNLIMAAMESCLDSQVTQRKIS